MKKNFHNQDLDYLNHPKLDLSYALLSRVNPQRRRYGNVNFSFADLHLANFDGADLPYSEFYFADMSVGFFMDSNLSHATMCGANMGEIHLMNADLSEANLRDANLTRADLHGAIFTNSDLRGAILDRANCIDVNFNGAIVDGPAWFDKQGSNGVILRWLYKPVKTTEIVNKTRIPIFRLRRNLLPIW